MPILLHCSNYANFELPCQARGDQSESKLKRGWLARYLMDTTSAATGAAF
jgi:hypothetical protein